MILGDNPTGHGFVLRDLILIELSGMHSPLQLGGEGKGGGGIKISEKFLLGGSRNFEVKIKTA